ncbi:Retrovirus-related Pol polyprotein from transposon RE1, partial [Linum perenne]
LGIEVNQYGQDILLRQSAYELRILEKFSLVKCNSTQTLIEPRLKFSKGSTCPLVHTTNYRSIVGSMRYLVHTRPDICYVVGTVSRYMEKPTIEHLAVVKHILRYVWRSGNFPRRFWRARPIRMDGYSDSDVVGDIDDGRSTTGVNFYLGTSPINWFSWKQRTVALSSCEAGYMATTAAVCQVF